MTVSSWRDRLANRLPFYYGWVIFAMASVPSFGARPVASVSVLSVFVIPMTREFDWSRGLFSGAVSLGAVCGLLVSPFAGRLIDRYGSRLTVAGCSLVVGVCAIGLSLISQAWVFYAVYVPGRAVFSSPLELGTSTAISNWFVRRRPLALALFGALQGIGLTVLPIIAALLITGWGWRTAWVTLGAATLAIGIVPALLLMVRRPEDMGMEPDTGRRKGPAEAGAGLAAAGRSEGVQGTQAWQEVDYTVREALRTRAFWVLALFSMGGFMVQSGVSLHQVPHYIDEGVPVHLAAFTASAFAFGQIPGGLVWSSLGRAVPVRVMLSLSALVMAAGAFGAGYSGTLPWGTASALALGAGVGGLHTLLRLAWADYYGRLHLGSIRGLTLPAQIGGQAIGPVLAGFMFDATGSYRTPFVILGFAAAACALMVLAAVPPRRN